MKNGFYIKRTSSERDLYFSSGGWVYTKERRKIYKTLSEAIRKRDKVRIWSGDINVFYISDDGDDIQINDISGVELKIKLL